MYLKLPLKDARLANLKVGVKSIRESFLPLTCKCTLLGLKISATLSQQADGYDKSSQDTGCQIFAKFLKED